MKKPLRVIVPLVAMAVLSAHPLTRYYVWLILPLGSGPDDFIVGAVLIAIALFAIAYHISRDKKAQARIHNLFNEEDHEG